MSTYIYKAVLGNLGFARTYSYRVGGTDAEGQALWSPIYSFTTRPETAGAKTADVPSRTGGVDCYRSPSGTIYMQNAGSGLGSDLKGGLNGKLNTNTQDITAGFRNRLPILRDAEVGYESSFAVFDISCDTLKVNRYYIDASLNSRLYDNGQFQISK